MGPDAMRHSLSLVIFAVMLTWLGSYWSDLQPASEQRPIPGEAQSQTLLTFEPAKALSFEIRREREPAIEVRRSANGEWFLESPFHARAEVYLVDRLLTVLNLIDVAQSVPYAKPQLSQFGLGEAVTTRITVETEQGRHWIELGTASANGSMRYARSSAREQIALVEQKGIQALPRNPGELLDRRIFPLAEEPLRALEVKEGKRSVVLQAGSKGWMIVSPLRADADRQIMAEWLKQLAGLYATDVHPFTERPGPGSPLRRIGSLTMAAGHVRVTTDLFRTAERMVVRRSDQPDLQFEMSLDAVPVIFLDPFTLRNKHLIQAEAGVIALVELPQPGRWIRLARTQHGWTRNGRLLPGDQSVAIEGWLAELRLSQGSELLAHSARCRASTRRQWDLRLRDRDGRILGRLALARTQACGDLATLPSGEWVRLQHLSLIDQLPRLAG